MRTTILLLILTSIVTAQQPATAKPGSVSGRVVNAANGEPLRKATVTLTATGEDSGPARTVLSNAEGNFQFSNVTPGKYSVSAQRIGFLTQRLGSVGRVAPAVLTITAGQEATNIELKLTPHGVIAGRVIDPDGDPVQNAQVNILRIVSQAGKMSLSGVSGVSTNDLGDFRAAGLPQGRYYVTATAPRRNQGYRGGMPQGRIPEGEKEDWVVTYFPSSANTLGASPIDVRAGSESGGVQIQLRRAPILQVRGQVSGTPGQRMTLMLVSADRAMPMGPSQMTQVARDSTFVFRAVTPGSYQIVAQRMDRRPITLARVPLQVGTGDVDGVIVRLQEPAAVSGVIKFDKSVTTPPDISESELYLQPAEGNGTGMRDSSVGGKLLKDGSFTFTNVSIDRMIFYPYSLPDGVYLKSVKLGEQEVIESGIDLANSGPQVRLEATLAVNGGSLQGQVTIDGKPASNYTVTVQPEPARPFQPWLTRTATTDANGNYRVRTLAPGEYRVFAWEEIAKEFLADTEFLKRFEASGSRVTIKESTAQTVDLTPVNTTESK